MRGKTGLTVKIQVTRDLTKADWLTAPLPRAIQSNLSVDSTKRLPDPNRPLVVTSLRDIDTRSPSVDKLPTNERHKWSDCDTLTRHRQFSILGHCHE